MPPNVPCGAATNVVASIWPAGVDCAGASAARPDAAIARKEERRWRDERRDVMTGVARGACGGTEGGTHEVARRMPAVRRSRAVPLTRPEKARLRSARELRVEPR